MTKAPRALLRRGGGLLVAVLAVFAFAGAAFAAAGPKFPALTGRVVDDAHILSPATVQKLDGELGNLEAQTGHQVVVATVPDLQGYEIEDYGYQLGRTWQIGRKGLNDGAILLVAPKEHKVRIEIGYGLEPVLTDALTSVILQQKVLPQFKQGHMEQGVVDGAEALIAQLALPEDQAKAKVAQAAAQPRVQAHDRGGIGPQHIPVFLIILLVFWVISALLRSGGRRAFGGLWWLPFLFMGGGRGGGDGWGGGGGGGGGGFSGGGGSFGGGGSSGSW